jgi:chemotaxis protein CheD
MGMASPRRSGSHADGELSRLDSNAPVLGERQQAYLLPGQLHASAEACQIKTILGSCVSICLWDKRLGAGGMNHFLLPASREGQPGSLRFADVATEMLLERLRDLGCRPPHVQAKIFGGAAIFQDQDRYAASLGARNVAAALYLMKKARIPVIAQETGGAQGRKVIFNTDDGTAWSRKV